MYAISHPYELSKIVFLGYPSSGRTRLSSSGTHATYAVMLLQFLIPVSSKNPFLLLYTVVYVAGSKIVKLPQHQGTHHGPVDDVKGPD